MFHQWMPEEIRTLGRSVGLTAIEIRDWSRNPAVIQRYAKAPTMLEARVKRAEELAIAAKVLLQLATDLEIDATFA